MMNPLLSVIIPVYNVEAYLDRCISSILSQSYKKIELILIDDGSTDNSGIKCDKWAKKDERIIVIHKDNGGVSSARNEGLKVVSGDYITFVDPDDFIEADTYKSNMDYLITHPKVDIIQYPYCHYINDQEITNYYIPPSQSIIGTEEIFRSWWAGTPLGYVIWNKIFKRHLWFDIHFSVGHTSEDTFLVPMFVKRAKHIFISEHGLYYYQRSREDSYTYNYDFKKHLDLFYAHAAIYEWFDHFPNMVTEKVLAFTRLFRRLITAMQYDDRKDLSVQLSLVQRAFPSWHDIITSQHTEKIWLSTAKLIGVYPFTKFFGTYLHYKNRWTLRSKNEL